MELLLYMGTVGVIVSIIAATSISSIIIYLSKRYDDYYWKKYMYGYRYHSP